MRYKLTPMNRSPAFNPLRFVETIVPAKPREALIAERAYFRAERRGFEPGTRARTGSRRKPRWINC